MNGLIDLLKNIKTWSLMMSLDLNVMDDIDSKLNDLMENIQDEYPEQSTVGELYVCMQQVVIEMAIKTEMSKQDYLKASEKIWNIVEKGIERRSKMN